MNTLISEEDEFEEEANELLAKSNTVSMIKFISMMLLVGSMLTLMFALINLVHGG